MVDDDEDTRELLGFALRQRGATVEVCASGAAALGHLATSPADVVLCDLVLPDMDGGELMARVRATGAAAVWFGLSGHPARQGDAFDHFRLKPIDIHELVGALSTLKRATPAPPTT